MRPDPSSSFWSLGLAAVVPIDHDFVCPGRFVRARGATDSFGTVVSVIDNTVTVLWSRDPRYDGVSLIDVSYVYAPYVPLQVTMNYSQAVTLARKIKKKKIKREP